jgi:undecaprenyl-phosphate 4-deoxy-4-formamido-L-arabinose transferase
LVFIDDGSRDGSLDALLKLKAGDAAVRIIKFTRNFGQQAAVLAGFRLSRGEIVVQIDSDLQHPPEEIPKLLNALRDDVELVTTTPKKRNDSLLRVIGSSCLLWIGQTILGKHCQLNLSSFRAMRRSVIEKIDACSDRSRYMAVLMSWLGVPSVEIEVEHHNRLQGKTKYGFMTLIKLAWDMVTSFSSLPLRIVTYLGFLGALLGFLLMLLLVYQRVVMGILIEGFILMSAAFSFFAGVQLLGIGLVGEYLGRIYLQVQGRPDYVVQKVID